MANEAAVCILVYQNQCNRLCYIYRNLSSVSVSVIRLQYLRKKKKKRFSVNIYLYGFFANFVFYYSIYPPI